MYNFVLFSAVDVFVDYASVCVSCFIFVVYIVLGFVLISVV